MYISVDKNNIITAASDVPFSVSGQALSRVDVPRGADAAKLVGREVTTKARKKVSQLRVAAVCNWGDACGIATYSKFLLDEVAKKVADLHVFAEALDSAPPEEPGVTRCWKRGQSVSALVEAVRRYDPDFVIVQHEFGIFPKAGQFLQFLQGIDGYPYVLTMHSVYEHLDKAVCTSAVKNIVVHTPEGEAILRRTGNNNNIFVIPHGCVKIPPPEREELWNIFQTPFAIVQFGFGFYYKGVDTALEAVALLKKEYPDRYKDIFYCYLCSENPHAANIHTNYFNYLMDRAAELGVSDNIAVIRKFQTEQTINHYLRTAKLALFPYRSDPTNVVYGASGATRVAMANGIPCIVGKNHQFDDLEGVLPRAGTPEELAHEIHKMFADWKHRKRVLDRTQAYINANDWTTSADRYLDLYAKVLPPRLLAKPL